MGYTNYFHIKPCKKEFSASVIGKVKKILSTYETLYSERLVKGFCNRQGILSNGVSMVALMKPNMMLESNCLQKQESNTTTV